MILLPGPIIRSILPPSIYSSASQVNQTNNDGMFRGSVQPQVRSGPPWERNEYKGDEGFESWSLSGAFIGKDTDGTGLTLFTVSIRIEVPAVAEKLFKLWLLKGKFFVAKPISEDCVCKTVDFEGKD